MTRIKCKIILISLIIASVILSSLILPACKGNGDISGNAADVSRIRISAYPTTEYKIDEKFSAAGGKLKVYYNNDTSTEMDLSAAGVNVSDVDTATAGKKPVTVTYAEASTEFFVYVVSEEADVPPVDPDDPVDPGEDDTNKTVVRVEIATAPDKTEYFVGDKVDFTGCVLKVTYSDRSVGRVPVTKTGVEFENVDTSKTGAKRVKISYRGRNANVTINIVAVGGVVTFRNGGVTDDFSVRVAEGRAVTEPATPVKEGYTFAGWFEDEECTVEYLFLTTRLIAEDINIYAYWRSNAETYYGVTFDLNYYGNTPAAFRQFVKAGEAARPIADPVRAEFTFDGWYLEQNCETRYDNGVIVADTVLYAKWNKTKTGSATYVYEAEDTDLSGKTGPGMSGEAVGSEMIVADAGTGASGGRYVSFLYKKGLSLEFHVASSEDVSDAVLAVSVAAELENINLNAENYLLRVNGVNMNYAAISLPNGGGFADSIVVSGVKLLKGHNLIELITNNDVNPAGGGTYAGTAPMVDCIKITTTSVLQWDQNYGLPLKNY